MKPDKNSLYFKLNNFSGSKKIVIKYNISNEETYSDSCTMALIFCNEFCEINKSNTQNCIECKNNYFPFPEGISNCFDDKEEELNTKEEGSIKLETKSYYSDKEILTSIKEEHKTNIKKLKLEF